MIDYSNDYLHWDNPQEVVVATIRNGVKDETNVSHALAGDPSRRLLASSGVQVQGDEQVWMIPVALLPEDAEIGQGDEIAERCGTKCGPVWRVLSATLRGIGSHNTHWECLCRRSVT